MSLSLKDIPSTKPTPKREKVDLSSPYKDEMQKPWQMRKEQASSPPHSVATPPQSHVSRSLKQTQVSPLKYRIVKWLQSVKIQPKVKIPLPEFFYYTDGES